MEVIFLDSDFKQIYILDKFKSLIWVDRYDLYGDFEIVTTPNSEIWAALISTAYLKLKESEHLMFLEVIHIHSDIEVGYELTIKGRSLESMLDRRIAWDPISLIGNFQNGIKLLLDNNAIAPSLGTRDITNLQWLTSTDTTITSLVVDEAFYGEDLYKIISSLCRLKGIGFKILLTSTNKFEFSLYNGIDRSYEQETNPHVIFSPDFDNLTNSDYVKSSQLIKTTAIVAGEKGVGNVRTTIVVNVEGDGGSDLDRKELFVDASGITRNKPGGGQYTEIEYAALLAGKGGDELAKYQASEAYEAESNAILYTYGVDYLMGDILQTIDNFGIAKRTRIIEIIFSQDPSGIKIYPTFSMID